MGQNIFVGILCIIALAAGFWGWWIDHGDSVSKNEEKHVSHLPEDK